MGERNQVAAWDFVDGLAEPLVCHACLKVAQKEPIVFTNHHVNRNVGPLLEVRGLAEGDPGFPAFVRGSFFGDILWHIMEEIRGEIKLDAVANQRPSASAREYQRNGPSVGARGAA
jgi:hypothetical protein